MRAECYRPDCRDGQHPCWLDLATVKSGRRLFSPVVRAWCCRWPMAAFALSVAVRARPAGRSMVAFPKTLARHHRFPPVTFLPG
jgi:hypothetical protein